MTDGEKIRRITSRMPLLSRLWNARGAVGASGARGAKGAPTHLDDVGMSYVEQMLFSLSLGHQFLRHALFAYGHALCPSRWTDASTEGLVHIRKMMNDKRDEVLLRRHNARVAAQHRLMRYHRRDTPFDPREPFPSEEEWMRKQRRPITKQFFSYTNGTPFKSPMPHKDS